MRTRQYSVDDVLLIVDTLNSETFPLDKVPKWKTNGRVWLVNDGQSPVAFLYCEPLEHTPNYWYFSRVGVLPKYKGRGIQRDLMKRMEKQLAGNTIVSTTFENPASANNFVARRWKTYLPNQPWGYPGTIYWIKTV